MKPLRPPIVHKLEERARQRPDYREGPLGSMLIALIGVVGLGVVLLLTYGGPA